MRAIIKDLVSGIVLSAAVLLAMPVAALTLDEAKSQGLVGERPSGYLGVVKAHPDAQAVANDINAKRRKAYEEIAQRNGTRVDQVETLAGEKAIANTKPGHMIQSATGEWIRK